jgi:hypothetical protein
MKTRIGFWSSVTTAALLCGGLAVPVHAGPTALISPEIAVASEDTPICRIVNAGTADIKVKIQLVGGRDVVVEKTVQVAPGNSESLIEDGISGGGLRCQFSGAFAKSLVRASIDVVDSNFRTFIVAPAQ